MLVTPGPFVESVGLIVDGKNITLRKGMKAQLDFFAIKDLLAGRQLVKTDYPEILNDEVVVFERADDDPYWRPVGRPRKR